MSATGMGNGGRRPSVRTQGWPRPPRVLPRGRRRVAVQTTFGPRAPARRPALRRRETDTAAAPDWRALPAARRRRVPRPTPESMGPEAAHAQDARALAAPP